MHRIAPLFYRKEGYAVALFALLATIILVKYSDLYLPFFWDELGVYGLSVSYQYHHQLSLMPGSVPTELSRGHPLLFTCLNALWWRISGHSMFSAHVFILAVSLLLIFLIYKKVSLYINPLAGLMAAAFLAVQPLFLGQACLVLPEVTLALFAFLALSAYYEAKYFQYMVFASCAILTKESAVVIPAACLAFSLLQTIMYRKWPDSLKPGKFLFTIIPYVVFGIFLLVQKAQNGWYFFPYHLEGIKPGFAEFGNQFSGFFDCVFWAQGRYWAEKLLFVALILAILTNRVNWNNAGKSFLTLVGIFMLAFLCFSSLIDLYMDRYVFSVLAGASVLVGAALASVSRNKPLIFSIAFFFCYIAHGHWEEGSFQYDADLGYHHCVRTLQQAMNYYMDISGKSDTVYGHFPAWFAMHYPDDGYTRGKKINTADGMYPNVDYFISCSPGNGFFPDKALFKTEQLKEFREGFARATVYRTVYIKEK